MDSESGHIGTIQMGYALAKIHSLIFFYNVGRGMVWVDHDDGVEVQVGTREESDVHDDDVEVGVGTKGETDSSNKSYQDSSSCQDNSSLGMNKSS
jgi:hypothetical protein